MKLSVVIPFWNAERWLATSIGSVIAQDHPAEIIVVDDGSTDGGRAVAEGYGSRVTVIRQENAGVSAARNRGLAAASGDYVIFLDADDYFEGPVLSGVARAAAGGHDIIFSRSASQSPRVRREHRHRARWPSIGPMGIALDIASGRTVAVHAQAFRRAAVERFGGYRVGEISTQDTELLLRWLILGATVGFNEDGVAIWAIRADHDGLSTRRDHPTLAAAHAWHRDHIKTLPVSADPALRAAYALRAYGIAGTAFENGYRELGRDALLLAREAGMRGHPGGRTHRLVAGAIGLEHKVALARAARRVRSAIGLPKKPPVSPAV